jgi:hypothetical protein
VRRENGGPGAARETGRQLARGEFIQYLDSDDLLMPRKFELQVAGLRANPDCDISYGWTRWRRPDGSSDPRPAKRTGETIATLFPSMLQSRWWETVTPLYRASLVERVGAWLPLRMEEDWEYDARAAALGVKLHRVDDWVAEMRRHDAGHLSGHGGAFHDRAVAHESIYASARRAGIGHDVPEMQHFARELFLLSRQCGAAGFADDSQRLFDLSRDASGPRRDRVQFALYRAVAKVAGWRGAGRMAALIDKVRP